MMRDHFSFMSRITTLSLVPIYRNADSPRAVLAILESDNRLNLHKHPYLVDTVTNLYVVAQRFGVVVK